MGSSVPSTTPSRLPSVLPSVLPSAVPSGLPTAGPTINLKEVGEGCEKKSECISKKCKNDVCTKKKTPKENGEKCNRDSKCISKKCKNDVCEEKKTPKAPDCSDIDGKKFNVNHSSGNHKGCIWLRNHEEEKAEKCVDSDAKLIRKKTCNVGCE